MNYKSKKYLPFALILLFNCAQTSNNRQKIDYKFEIGKRLFYDKILSSDNTLSCSSCHRQEYSFGYQYDRRHLTTEDKALLRRFGNRDVQPLFNLLMYNRYMWDGRAKSLMDQVSLPIYHLREFNTSWAMIEAKINCDKIYIDLFKKIGISSKIDSVAIISMLVYFETKLISNRSRYDLFINGKIGFSPDENKGLQLFNELNCVGCHKLSLEKYQKELDLANNGLLSSLDSLSKSAISSSNNKIRVPNIRNWGFTAPYSHTGSIPWIEQYLNRYIFQNYDTLYIDKRMYKLTKIKTLTQLQKKQLMAFLNTLNDTAFINDKKFQSPFK